MIPKENLHNDYLKYASGSIPNENYYIYRKDPLEKVNDYTKNIS